MLGTEEDINRRKKSTVRCFQNNGNILIRSKKISEKIRIRVFKTYLESVFLYNSELCTLTSTLDKQIDSFQRKQS